MLKKPITMLCQTAEQFQRLKSSLPENAIIDEIRDTVVSLPEAEPSKIDESKLGWIVTIDPNVLRAKHGRNLAELGEVLFDPNADVPLLKENPFATQDRIAQARAAGRVMSPQAITHIDQIDGTVDGRYGLDDDPGEEQFVVYVVDSGINDVPQEFGARIIHRINTSLETDHIDRCTHGTHVAGTIGGASVGLCPKVKLVAVKVFESTGHGLTSQVIRGLSEALKYHRALGGKKGAVNMSLSGPPADKPLFRNILGELAEAGLFSVAAAGNYQTIATNFAPAGINCEYKDSKERRIANMPAFVVAGGLSTDGSKLASSNLGVCVDVYVQGTVYSILGLNNGQPIYKYKSGTSMATPTVTGFIIKMWAKNPHFSAAQIADHVLKHYTRAIKAAYDYDCAGTVDGKKTLSFKQPDPLADLKIAFSKDFVSVSAPQLMSKPLNDGESTGFSFNMDANKELGFNLHLADMQLASGELLQTYFDTPIACSDPIYTASTETIKFQPGNNWINVKKQGTKYILEYGTGNEIGKNLVKRVRFVQPNEDFLYPNPLQFLTMELDTKSRSSACEISSFKSFGKAIEATSTTPATDAPTIIATPSPTPKRTGTPSRGSSAPTKANTPAPSKRATVTGKPTRKPIKESSAPPTPDEPMVSNILPVGKCEYIQVSAEAIDQTILIDIDDYHAEITKEQLTIRDNNGEITDQIDMPVQSGARLFKIPNNKGELGLSIIPNTKPPRPIELWRTPSTRGVLVSYPQIQEQFVTLKTVQRCADSRPLGGSDRVGGSSKPKRKDRGLADAPVLFGFDDSAAGHAARRLRATGRAERPEAWDFPQTTAFDAVAAAALVTASSYLAWQSAKTILSHFARDKVEKDAAIKAIAGVSVIRMDDDPKVCRAFEEAFIDQNQAAGLKI